MSILWSGAGDFEGDFRAEALSEGVDCFLCTKPLITPVVHWMGLTGNIYLHPDCVLRLAVRMFRDVHEIQNGRVPKPGDTVT